MNVHHCAGFDCCRRLTDATSGYTFTPRDIEHFAEVSGRNREIFPRPLIMPKYMKPFMTLPTLAETRPTIEIPQQELQAACLLAATEATLRQMEDRRKSLTAPMRKSLDGINAEAKAMAAPLEEQKADLQQRMGAYRARPEIREAIVRRERAESKLRYAEREGDAVGMRNAGSVIAEVNEVVPKSIPAGDGYVVRFRSKRTFEIAESELADRYMKKVPDLEFIEKCLDAGEVISGVTEHVTYTAYVVETNSPSPEPL